jgi:hypothetical protein
VSKGQTARAFWEEARWTSCFLHPRRKAHQRGYPSPGRQLRIVTESQSSHGKRQSNFNVRACRLLALCMDRPRVASRKVMIWRSWSCASVSGLLMEPLSSWPSWISARARSHSRLGPEGHTGHLITNALAKPFSISSFRLADLGGKANSTIVLGASLSVSHSPGECFRLPPS